MKMTSTREQIIRILSEDWPLSAKRIHNQLKKRFASGVTYQAVHKLLNILRDERILIQVGYNWKLNKSWMDSQLLFFKKVNRSYSERNDSLFSQLKVFFFDVNGVWTPELTHVELAHRTKNYAKVKKLITSQTLGKISIVKAFEEVSNSMKGISLFDVMEHASQIPLMEGAQELASFLKEKGVSLVLVTTGFTIQMEELNRRLGNVFDKIIANEFIFVDKERKALSNKKIRKIVESQDKKRMKEIKTDGIKLVIKSPETKTQLIKKHLTSLNFNFTNSCCVGDSMGDADMIKLASEKGGLGIAFNPNLSLVDYATYLEEEGNNVRVVRSKNMNDIVELFL